MPALFCFYLYTENLSLPVFVLILAYKKDTCQNMPVSLLHFFKITHLYSIKVIEISSVFTFFHIWYGNSGNRLTWSNFLTLAPSGFASLPFSRFAKGYSIYGNRSYFLSVILTSTHKEFKRIFHQNLIFHYFCSIIAFYLLALILQLCVFPIFSPFSPSDIVKRK